MKSLRSLSRHLVFFLTAVITAVCFFAAPSFVFAQSSESESQTAQFVAAAQVSLPEAYSGPVFASGVVVEFSGSTPQDLVVWGGSVIVSGTVEQDLYVAGGSVVISGTVQGNVIVAGGEVQLLPSANIGGSVIAVGQSIRVESPLTSDARLSGKNIAVLNSVAGNLILHGESISLASTASIAGNLDAEAEENRFSDQSTVLGARSINLNKSESAEGASDVITSFLYALGSRLLMLGLFLLFFPRILCQGADRMQSGILSLSVKGMVWLAAVPVAAVVSLMLVVGFPLAMLLAGLYCVLILIAWIFPTFALGARLLPKRSQWIQAAAGVGLVTVLSELPYLGIVVQVVLAVLGTGVLWSLLREKSVVRSSRSVSKKSR